jgi:hypothetical protein
MGVGIMDTGVSSEVRESYEVASQQEDPEQLKSLLEELLSELDERQLLASLL